MKTSKTLSIILGLLVALNSCRDTNLSFENSQLESQPPSSTITTSGRVEQNETWQGEILITGDVEIQSGVTVTIQPGTIIRFTAQRDDQHSPDEYDPEDESTLQTKLISIIVIGALEVLGTPENPILFTSDREQPGEMDWESIIIEGDGSVTLEHATIEWSHLGLQLNSPTLILTVSHTTFRDISTCAICGHGAHPNIEGPVVISDSYFIRCGREAIDTYPNQNFIVQHNVFSANYVAIMSVGSAIIVEDNLFVNNERGIGIIEGGTPSIAGNAFSQNGTAIFIVDASPTIVNNNLFDNLLNFQMEGGSRDLFAENNWWGSADSLVIGESIFDGRDDPNLGIVYFEPFADQAFSLNTPPYE